MVVAKFIDGCVFLSASPGLGSFVVAAASAGWRTPAQAGALDGGIYRYRAYSFDQSQWEIGTGVYTAATQTLTRDIILASTATVPTDKMDFLAPPTVALTVHAEDFLSADAVAGKVNRAGDTMTGPLLLPNGSGTGPVMALGFASEPTAGIYRASAGIIRYVSGGVTVLEMQATGRVAKFYGQMAGVASTVTAASMNLPHGVAPTSPANGDIWTTTAGVFTRVNGVTMQLNDTGAYVSKTGDTMTGDLTIAKSNVRLLLEKVAGTYAALAGGVAGKFRWSLQLGNNEAEGGGNSGSNFNFDRYDDAGNYLGTALNINRATGDMLTQGNLTMDKANPDLILNKKASGQGARLGALMNGLSRWWMHLGNDEAESGGNNGSHFVLYAYDDAGADLGEALRIQRYSKEAMFGGPVLVPNGTGPNVGIGFKSEVNTGFILQAAAQIRVVTNGHAVADFKDNGRTMTFFGKATGIASTVSAAPFNAPHGVAPTTPADGDIWTTTAGIFTRVNGVTMQLNGNGQYLPLTGGNLSGNLQIIKNTPNLVLEKTAAGQSSGILGRVNAAARWWMFLGDTAAEGGADAGSDFALNRYDDAGVSLGTALSIQRASGNATLRGSLTLFRDYPALTLRKTAQAQDPMVYGYSVGGVPRWGINMGDQAVESTGNNGTNWWLARYNDAGAWLDNVLAISRAAATVTGSAIATAAQYFANTAGKLLTTDGLWAAAAPVTVAYAASITLNFSSGINFAINPVSGALTLANPLNAKAGQSGFIWLGATGNHALAFGTSWWFPPGGKPTAMGSNDVLHYEVLNSGVLFCSYVKSYA